MYSITNNYFSVGSLMKKLGVGVLKKVHDHMNKVYKKKNDLEYSYYSEGGGNAIPEFNVEGHANRKDAKAAFEEWKKQYRKSNNGQVDPKVIRDIHHKILKTYPSTPESESELRKEGIIDSIERKVDDIGYVVSNKLNKLSKPALNIANNVKDNITKKVSGISSKIAKPVKIAAGVAGGAVVLGSTAKLLNAIANLKRARNK